MVKYAAKNEIPIALPSAGQLIVTESCMASIKVKKAAAEIVGIANRNEKRAPVVLEKPKNSAQVIVTPAREVPGTRASVWASPIIAACVKVIAESPFPPFLLRSASQSNIPKPMVVPAIIGTVRSSVSMNPFSQ